MSLVLLFCGSCEGVMSRDSSTGIAGSIGSGRGLVDLVPCCCICMWPVLVASDLGKCLLPNELGIQAWEGCEMTIFDSAK